MNKRRFVLGWVKTAIFPGRGAVHVCFVASKRDITTTVDLLFSRQTEISSVNY